MSGWDNAEMTLKQVQAVRGIVCRMSERLARIEDSTRDLEAGRFNPAHHESLPSELAALELQAITCAGALADVEAWLKRSAKDYDESQRKAHGARLPDDSASAGQDH